MSGCTSATVPARSAVSAPTHATTVDRVAARARRTGWRGTTRKTPAVTIVAAWISAETGVGPSIASGSQRCRRDLRALADAADEQEQGDRGGRRLRRRPPAPRPSPSSRGCRSAPTMKNIAIMKPKSPTRLVTNAFLPALDAASPLDTRTPISRYEQRPTPSQPRNVSRKLDGEDEHQHRRGEQVEVGEEPREPLVAVHVADRVEVDQRADAGDQQDPGDRERVGEEADVHRRSWPAWIQVKQLTHVGCARLRAARAARSAPRTTRRTRAP